MFAYYFRSKSGKEYLDFSEKDLDIVEAMLEFEWDDAKAWTIEGDILSNFPYASFIKKKVCASL